jgi:hypothetical protein
MFSNKIFQNVVVVAMVFLSCGATEPVVLLPDGGVAPMMTVDLPVAITDLSSACRAIFSEQCRVRVACGDVRSAAECEYKESDCAPAKANIASGKFAFNQPAATACYNGFRAATCQTYNAAQYNEACQNLLVGTAVENSNCTDRDCSPSLTCDNSATCPGRCVPRVAEGQMPPKGRYCAVGTYEYNGICQRLIAIGGSCNPVPPSSETQQCAWGSTCSDSTRTCVTIQPSPLENQPCGRNDSCALGLYCKNGTCLKPSAANVNCDSVTYCQNGLFCSTANVCIPTAPQNGMCRSNTECGDYAVCLFINGQATGTCQARSGKVGQSCVAEGSPGCGEGYCTATVAKTVGVCATKKSRSAACSRSIECEGNDYCTATGICAAPKSAGASCKFGEECGPNAFCGANSLTCVNKFGPGAACGENAVCLGYCTGTSANPGVCRGCR